MFFHMLLILATVIRLASSQTCVNCTESDKSNFLLLEYNDGYFFTSTSNCVCRYNMSLHEEECVKFSDINNNYGSVLLAVPDASINSLILCGTGEKGICEMKDFMDLCSEPVRRYLQKLPETFVNTTSVASEDEGATVAFTSWGQGDTNETILYTAARPRKDHNFTSSLSIRSLKKDTAFQLFRRQGIGSRIEVIDQVDIRTAYQSFYPVGGFSHNGTAYFLSNQIENMKLPTSKVAKLIRLCQHDTGIDHLLSYMDIKIECSGLSSIQFAMLQPAGHNFRTFTKVPTNTSESDVLIAAFGGQNKTSMCLYTFEEMREKFSVANPLNYDRYLEPTAPTKCSSRRNHSFCEVQDDCRNFIADDLWSLPVFQLLIVSMDIVAMATTSINGGMHSLFLTASNRSENHTVINLYYIGGVSEPQANSIRNFTVAGVVKALKVIKDKVYILKRSRLTSENLYNDTECSTYASFYDCVAQQDPFCGWCRASMKCSIRSKCDASTWRPITTNPTSVSNISVDAIFPQKGPLSGGTLLTLTGKNFDLYKEISVTVGGSPCTLPFSHHRNATTLQCLTSRRSKPETVNVNYTTSNAQSANVWVDIFEYLEDPTVSGISPNKSFESGGRMLTVVGTNFDVIQAPELHIVGSNISEKCKHKNSSVLVCSAPTATQELKEELEKGTTVGDGCSNQDVVCVDVEFKMDGVNSSLLRERLEIARDPEFYNFTEEHMTKQYSPESRSVIIKGDRINISASASDFYVTVGTERCDVLASKVFRYELHCLPPGDPPKKVFNISSDPEVQVQLGYIKRHVGYLHYLPEEEEHYLYLYIIVSLLVVIVIVLIVLGVLLRRRSRRAVTKLKNEMDEMEMRIQTEFKQAFADLQTDMTDITGELVETGLPYNKFPVYAFQILFPSDDVTLMTSHKVFSYPETSADVTDVDTAMSELDTLFSNKFFVLSVINTLEQQKKLSMQDKAAFAGYLAAGLLQNLNYFSQLVKELLELYVEDAVSKKKQKGLFRRYESITEKLTVIWMEICLHQHISKHRGGSALIMLVKAIQIVMEKSPIDVVTGAARATLSYDQLLLAKVDNDNPIRLKVQINEGEFDCACHVLECDTIPQAKAKCLGFMYKKDPASTRPTKDSVDLQWHCGKQGRLILQEEETCPSDDNHVKLMTLADYHVTDGSVMELLNRKVNDEEEEYVNYQNNQNQLSQSEVHLLVEDEEEQPDEPDKEPTVTESIKYHLVKPQEDSKKSKVFPETHLHKLLQTKMNIKQFVDEAIDSALDKKDIPVVVKYLFTVLEGLATTHGVDQDTLLSWKNNCYPIRFWGRLMSRPRIVFDIETPDYLQPSLDIVASTFIDSFSPPQTLSKNSTPHKLLFFKDLEEYRAMVKSFHRGVSNAPIIDEREMVQEMQKITSTQQFNVNRTSVFYEIYRVIRKYKNEITEGLEEDKEASKLQLSEKLEHVLDLMSS